MTELHDAHGVVHDDHVENARSITHNRFLAILSLEKQCLAAEVISLACQLREMQARAAASADATRQQIERDLHDGAQQRLIALRIKLQLTAEGVGDRASETAQQLNRLGDEVQRAIDELRALARGVFPRTLADFGPVEAVRDIARSAAIPTTVNGINVGRRSPEVERAVHFCCLEALQNTYEHAPAATAAEVTLAASGHELTFEVTDNGLGFDLAAVAVGAGLQNMHDRIASLGGIAVCWRSARVRGAGQRRDTAHGTSRPRIDGAWQIDRAVQPQTGLSPLVRRRTPDCDQCCAPSGWVWRTRGKYDRAFAGAALARIVDSLAS